VVDASCASAKGDGDECWLRHANPKVLQGAGIDPNDMAGALPLAGHRPHRELKYGIPDLRAFFIQTAAVAHYGISADRYRLNDRRTVAGIRRIYLYEPSAPLCNFNKI